MSRIGKKPITIPKEVTVSQNGQSIKIKGPKGELQNEVHPNISVKITGDEIIVSRPNDFKRK